MGSNGLQNEFEEFIQNLIQQVSEDIFLEDLKRVYESYQECLKGIQIQSEKMSESAVQMREEWKLAAGDLKGMKQEMEENTGRVEKALDIFYEGYKEILQQYEEKIVFLNEKERENYTKQLQGMMIETREKEKRELEESFHHWEGKIEKLTGTIATTESVELLTGELEQVRETIKNTTDIKYLEKLTDFENKLKHVGESERKDMESKVKAAFEAERERTRQMLQSYQNSLTEVTARTITKKEMVEFQKQLSQYTKAVQSIADKRYEEALKAFEENLFKMGSMQFSNYIRTLNETAIKVSDLEIFLRQVKMLEESMKQQISKSEEDYKIIFAGFRADVQKVNQENKQDFMNSLTNLFGQQYDRMKQSMDAHIQVMEKFQTEQKELIQCVEKIRELAEKSHTNLNLIARAVAGMAQKQDLFLEKLTMTADAVEDNTKQLEYTMQLVEDGNKQLKNSLEKLEEQKEVLNRVTEQNDNSIRQMQNVTRKLDGRTEKLSEQMEEVLKSNKEQSGLLKAMIGESPEWKIELFERFEINLVYVILIMLAWICLKVV